MPGWSNMTAGLAIGITLAVGAAGAAGAYLYSVRHTRSLLEGAKAMARSQGELIQAALEHQMMEDDRTLIARMIESFGRQPNVERVVLLDRSGTVRYASAPAAATDFAPDSPTCQACHQLPAAQRMNSRVIETEGGSVLRTVLPVRNQERCQSCHDPSHTINGVLMLDLDMETVRAGTNQDLRWMVLATGVLTLLLIGGLAVLVRVFVLRRLQQFETTARQIAGGDLARRVPAEGSDTIAWLAREFNTMADSMTNLLDDVHAEQQRLETVINSIDDGIVVLDPTRKVIAANHAFLARTGHPRSRIMGCSCGQPGAVMCVVDECPALACLTTLARQVRICQHQRSDGELRWEEVHASPVFGASGEVVQVVEVWRDISDRRAAEARLAESHRLASLGMLASGFSHELNTPLATVLTCVEGILREARDQDRRAHDWGGVSERATLAREQVLRCRGLTQHFLRMSRGQAPILDIVDVHATLAAVERLIAPTALAHGVRVVMAKTSGEVRVRANDAELQQVLINLVVNAIQASKSGSTVIVEVSADGATPGAAPADQLTRIRVVDRGCGIAPQNRSHIFEPFFSARAGGTGLGLFISLEFVRHWGGDIAVTSVPGTGSVFEVSMPSAVAGASSSAPERLPA
jgi:PAS domain S-box-containing protein